MDQNILSKAAGDLIYLVACAVNEEKPNTERCEAMDLREVYYAAQQHWLTSAAAFALERVMELPRPYDQAKKKAIHKLSLFDIERVIILNEFDKRGIWYLPMKGIVIGKLYPKSAMREMTDNDILFDSDKADVVREVMEGFGYSCDMYGESNHDVYSKEPTMEFEMHRALFSSDDYPFYAAYYENIKEKLIKDDDNLYGYHMTDEDLYIHIICHMHKHYSRRGTGLRSLLDIYIFNRKFYASLDKEYLKAELEKLELVKYEEKTRVLAEKVFTLGELDMKEEKELAYYAECGIYGTLENSERNKIIRNLGGDTEESKRRYFVKRVFISGETLEDNYPFVAKHKLLYPLLFVYRPIKGAIRRPKKLIREYKIVKGYKKDD